MKNSALIFICFIGISCSNDDVNKAEYSFEFVENSGLTINTVDESYMKYGVIEEGGKTVFKYRYTAEDDEQIADDEYSEYIYFEIEPDVTNFLIEDEGLIDAKVTLTKACFCFFGYDSEKDVAPKGSISGEKRSDNQWEIELNVTFYGDEEKRLNESFILTEG